MAATTVALPGMGSNSQYQNHLHKNSLSSSSSQPSDEAKHTQLIVELQKWRNRVTEIVEYGLIVVRHQPQSNHKDTYIHIYTHTKIVLRNCTGSDFR